MLEAYLKQRRSQKEILLMTHIVLGYPSYDDSYAIIKSMVEAGVDLMELQIPFSEPIADGPVILRANQEALQNGAKVNKCIKFAERITKEFDIPFLFMSYYNILFKYGIDRFVATMSEIGMKGAIVPDLPPEEANDYLSSMNANNLSPIFIFTPNTTDERLNYIAKYGKGFIYCIARKGVTGSATNFSQQLDADLARYRQATDLPLALGFGVQKKADIDFLKGKADIAVIGTQTIRLVDDRGVGAVKEFIQGLR